MFLFYLDWLESHPDSTTAEIIAGLKKKGVAVSGGNISPIKHALNHQNPKRGAVGGSGVVDGMIAKLDQEEAKLLERIEGIRQAKRVIQG